MAFDYKYMKGPIWFNHASADFVFNQNGDIQVPHNVELALNRGSGSITPGYVAVMSAKPMITWTTTEIARVMAVVPPMTGLLVATGQTYTSADFLFMRQTKGGTLYSGSNHLMVSAAAGMAVCKTLSAQQDGEANLAMEFSPYSTNGTTAQISYNAASSAPTGVIPSEKFTLGPVKVNGTAIDGLQGVEVDFGVVIKLMGANGNALPEFANIESITPKITIRGTDLSYAATVGLLGLTQGATQTDIYFRKLALGGSRVADATAEHVRIRINANQGMHVVESMGGSEVQDAEVSFTLQPIEGWIAGPTLVPPISISTAIAIP
jgi:hypothetical protein